ncbi:hypothetical protein ADIARSV_2201 [Arcticibacter svalbardensis MN12-7]|uniref:Uncharacterized protein n=1 Tax=Arcticibacter svalbardensis MN12-7 TaxID=1150600 RepID=R9GSD9_9SPHI|nr:hypothetical protein ADIARSV_2201 [Arcticibacter svalbardensis MN12-7]
MERYQVRWSIENFKKKSKQYLKIGKSQAGDIGVQFANISISMI